MKLRRLAVALLGAALLPAFTCSKRAAVDMPDKELPPPSQRQLEIWQREFEGGAAWRGDPCRFAHEEIQRNLDVPWKGEPFDPNRYEFTARNPEKPDWGSYVIRRYRDVSGRAVSYQVQISKHRSIWYTRKVRHYYSVELVHPALEDPDKPRH